MKYKAQFSPGTSQISENRKKYMNPSYKLEKLRSLSDEDIVLLLGHRAPGEDFKSVHPPLDEMGEPDCIIRELVEPTEGAKAGDRIRYVQFTDSVYFAPITPYQRSWAYMHRYRGVDCGTLSGRQIVEARERDVEKIAKELIETEVFDPARTGIRGRTVHGHAVRLDENGLMFDAMRRYVYDEETGEVKYIKNMVGEPIDSPVSVGKPLSEEELRKRTTMFRADGISVKEDQEILDIVNEIHWGRTFGGFKNIVQEEK
ncbi:MAG: coenzyme-B sulfoethylthiotransferase subunit gamma [Candidatus Methanofastidiosia archaeon]